MTEDVSIGLELVSRLGKEGKFDEALAKINACLRSYPESAQVHNMLGNVHLARGDMDAALDAYRLAIGLDDRFTSAYHSMADTYVQAGNGIEATRWYAKVLELEPNNSEALESLLVLRYEGCDYHSAQKLLEHLVSLFPEKITWLIQLAEVSFVLGDYASAAEYYEDIVLRKPREVEHSNRLGTIFFQLGDYERSLLAYQQAEQLEPENPSTLCNIGAVKFAVEDYWSAAVYFECSSKLAPQQIDLRQKLAAALLETRRFDDYSRAESMFLRVIEDNTTIDPQLLIDPVLFLLRSSPRFRELLKRSRENMSREATVELCASLQEYDLFLNIIQLCPVPDLEIEALLRDLRRSILTYLEELKNDERILPFQEALGLYSHANDFILSVTQQEKDQLNALTKETQKLLEAHRDVSPVWIACIASYLPLSTISWLTMSRGLGRLERLRKRHLDDYETEKRLRKGILSLASSNDPVSASVRSQYETYIYPRWVNTKVTSQAKKLSRLVKDLKLKLESPVNHFDDNLQLLVAGCGTGQHAIAASSRLKNSRTVAIDLSLSSLSYAKRKTLEFGLTGIDYINADILNLGKLGEEFEVIECCGVLHHMAEPLEGLASLARVLKPGGLMKIALYSSSARAGVSAIRQEVRKLGVENSIEDIRSFRAEIIHGTAYESALVKNITGWRDFYNSSECVDLIFHVQEHQFTLSQIKEYLAEVNLTFAGFEFSSVQVVNEFKRIFREPEKYYSLDAWANFEQDFPNTFAGMYQFWVQKNR